MVNRKTCICPLNAWRLLNGDRHRVGLNSANAHEKANGTTRCDSGWYKSIHLIETGKAGVNPEKLT